MDWNLKKVAPLATVALLSIGSLTAADNNCNKCPPRDNAGGCGNTCDAGSSMAPAGIAPAARCMLCCNKGWIVDVEALVWRANMDNLWPTIQSTATTSPLIGSASNFASSKFNHLQPKWDGGFRLGVGYDMAHDSWDILATWTYFHNHAHQYEDIDTFAFPVQTLTTLWSAFNDTDGSLTEDTAASVHAHWKLNLNMIDLELGRKMFVGQWLSIRPNVGLRGALIKQHYSMEYYPGTNVAANAGIVPLTTRFDNQIEIVNMHNNFGGVGVKAGLNTQWNFGCGWSLYGDSAFAIVYGAFDVDQHEQNGPEFTTNPNNTVLGIRDNFHASRGILDLALGFRWEHPFCDSNSCMAVSLGWEHHMFFDQIAMKRFVTLNDGSAGQTTTGGTVFFNDGGNLSTQGVTLGVRFDF